MQVIMVHILVYNCVGTHRLGCNVKSSMHCYYCCSMQQQTKPSPAAASPVLGSGVATISKHNCFICFLQ
jgi:hypothetical protein